MKNKKALRKEFRRVGSKVLNSKKKVRDSYDDGIIPLAERLCAFTEKDGDGKFEIIKREENDHDFLIGVKYFFRSSLVSSVEFGMDNATNDYPYFTIKGKGEREGYANDTTQAVGVLSEWSANVAPDIFSKLCELEEKREETRASYDASVKPFIEKLCALPEKDNIKFEIIERTDDNDFLMGVKYLFKGFPASSVEFRMDNVATNSHSYFVMEEEGNEERRVTTPTYALEVLSEWMTNIAPDRVSEMKKKQNIALRVLDRLRL